MEERFGYGADVGGTSVKLGFFSSERGLLEKWEIPTDSTNGGCRVVPDVAESIAAHRARTDIPEGALVGVCIAVPGAVVGERTVLQAVNIAWGRTEAADQLEALLKLPARCLNDANAAALGELWAGGGQGLSSLVMVTLGTGVGGGVVVGGRVIEGFNGSAGEIGHIQVEPEETRRCNCGCRGCLEYYASATGLTRLAADYLGSRETPSALRRLETITARDIWALAKDGDAAAAEITDRYCWYLGRGLAQVAAVCSPEAFVIGGGVSKAGAPLLEGARTYYREFAFPSCRDADFRLSLLGNDAGIYGCAYMLFNH